MKMELEEIKNKIVSLIDERESFYDFVVVQLTLTRLKEEWKISFGRFIVMSHGNKKPSPFEWNYGDFRLIQNMISLPEFRETVERFLNEKIIKLSKLSIEIPIEYSFREHESEYIPSERWPTHYQWPLNFFLFSISSPIPSISRLLFSKDLPLFPDERSAQKYAFKMDSRSFSYNWSAGHISFWLPNYKARIMLLGIKGDSINIEVEKRNIQDLKGKIYLTTEKRDITEELDFKTTKIDFPLISRPDYIYLCIFSNNDIIDSRELSLRGWPSVELSELMKYETTPEEIEGIISGGENEKIEFKEEITEGILKEICAFANTQGGRILIGVSDESEIKGIKEPEKSLKDRILKLVEGNFDYPFPKVTSEMLEIREKKILLINVFEGKEKPYLIRNRGIYIRTNGTSRHAFRSEIEKLFKSH